ncbi:MAG: hypothetical protein ACREV4_16735 [Gammaproteobacteria bacterium]
MGLPLDHVHHQADEVTPERLSERDKAFNQLLDPDDGVPYITLLQCLSDCHGGLVMGRAG